jgi:hypothetical protein
VTENHSPGRDKKRRGEQHPQAVVQRVWIDGEVLAFASVKKIYYSIDKYGWGLLGVFSYDSAWSFDVV